MTRHTYFSAGALLLALSFPAQEKKIDTIAIFDKKLRDAGKTQQVYALPAENILLNATNLSETLRFQSPVYVKENGRGAVASPSFRGTTAQQTSFVWNGIPVNSLFLGQGDLNNLSLLNYDQIEVKAGGGGVEYGSAAIGGSVHLNNSLSFNRGLEGKLFAEYGSFKTLNTLLKTGYSNRDFSVVFSAGISKSKNDYAVPEKQYLNRNGEYANQTFTLSAAYRLGQNQRIYWHTQQFFGDQHYPIFEVQQTRTKYLSTSFRSLAGWESAGNRYRNEVATAYLEEAFSYFPDLAKPRESGGLGKTFYFKDDFWYDFSPKIRLKIYTLAKQERGEGYQSGIRNVARWSGSAAALAQYSARKFFLELGGKKEMVEGVSAPYLYSLGSRVEVSPWFLVKFKGSKNFRYPSFNDLYWQPGGNINLKPEISHQAEITPQFSYGNAGLAVTGYVNEMHDMLRWLPTSAGYWAPQNTGRVKIKGLEATLSWDKKWGGHHLNGKIGYSFTQSQNAETGYQLSYVPKHKAFGLINYRWKPIGIYFQGVYNGQTFTSSNESRADDLEPYFVLNGGLLATIFKRYSVGFKIANLTDAVYETTAYYPLPKRNYSFNMTVNF